jgi:hypothetical protein
LLRGLCVAPAAALLPRPAFPAVVARRAEDAQIVEVRHGFEQHHYRAPYQFGGRTVDRVTILNVDCRIRTGDGREAWGFGSMTLGNAWAFPAAPHDVGLGAMQALAAELRRSPRRATSRGHPLDLWRVLEPAYLRRPAMSRARASCRSRCRSSARSSWPAPSTRPSTMPTARRSA